MQQLPPHSIHWGINGYTVFFLCYKVLPRFKEGEVDSTSWEKLQSSGSECGMEYIVLAIFGQCTVCYKRKPKRNVQSMWVDITDKPGWLLST